MNKNIKIAVYGTLREGYGNHGVLGNSKLIDSGWTKDKYKLTASGIPFVNSKEPISKIKVEVYDVTPEQLPIVDGLEGYRPGDTSKTGYYREPVPVELDGGEEIEASLYFHDGASNATLIESGDYTDYRNKY